jgi:plastocyanin
MAGGKESASAEGDGTEHPLMPEPKTVTGVRAIGAALLFASAGVHLDLYLTGYRRIPTIGWLFLVQVAIGIALGLAVLISSRRLVELSGASFAFGTIVGYSFSRFVGLFGFHERPTTAGLVAGLFELGAVAGLGAVALRARRLPARSEIRPRARLGAPDQRVSAALLALASAAALVLVLVLVSGIGDGGVGTTTSAANVAAGPVVHVVINNFAFAPAHLSARPGEVIVVHNEDSVDHTLTAEPGTSPTGHFNSGDIAPGATKDVTAPNSPGTYSFYCSIHNFMTGELTVS